MKNSFIIYTSTGSLFKKLNDTDAGRLIKAVFEYVENGDLPKGLSPGADMAFTAIKDYLDRDAAKYEDICRKRSEAGKLGGRPKANESKKSICKQNKAKKADIDIDNDIDIEIESESDNELRYYPNDSNLDQAFQDYVDMRKAIKSPMTERAITLATNKLETLSTTNGKMDNDLAIQILEQSTMNSWKGLFPIKDRKNIADDWRDV